MFFCHDCCDPGSTQKHYRGRLSTQTSREAEMIFFIWFGGPLYWSFQGPLFSFPFSPQSRAAFGFCSYQTNFKFFSLHLLGPGKKCLLKCRHPHYLAQSSYTMSLGSTSLPPPIYGCPHGRIIDSPASTYIC